MESISPSRPSPSCQAPDCTGALEALREQALIKEARARARRRRRNGALALAASALVALLGVRADRGGSHASPAAPRKPPTAAVDPRMTLPAGAALTLLSDPVFRRKDAADFISVVDRSGRLTRVWQCPRTRFCGHLLSAAWSPDGRRLAISLNHYAASTPYPGLRVIDTASGRDRQIIGASPTADVVLYGCVDPKHLAWSPDGAHIAYTCDIPPDTATRSAIHIMSADGSHERLLATGTTSASWPSWSPTGTRIAFSTATLPQVHPATPSAIYSVDLDGTHRRLLATGGLAPTWSPDGSRIAYRSTCGRVRLMTPAGRDVTPRSTAKGCSGIGPAGWPVWAPDARSIAITNQRGIYVIDAAGTQLRHIKPLDDRPPVPIPIRLAWRPLRERAPRAVRSHHPGT